MNICNDIIPGDCVADQLRSLDGLMAKLRQRIRLARWQLRTLELQRSTLLQLRREHGVRYPNRRVMVAVKQYWRRHGSGQKANWHWQRHDERHAWRCRG
jgi:hypothetical protein